MIKRARGVEVTSEQICNGLSKEQRAVVCAPLHGITASPSGAGSGKTRTIARRAQNAVLTRNMDPVTMCVLSFTRKACDAMRNVLAKVPGPGPTTIEGEIMRNVRVCTLHSIAASIIDASDESLCSSRDTCIVDATEVLRDDRIAPHEFLVQHVMVDEAQDNDPEQYQFLDAILAFIVRHHGRHCGLTIVGDARQAIYGFRGGSVEIFNDAATRYRGMGYEFRELPLSLNFRSTRQITTACNGLFRATALSPMRPKNVDGPAPTLDAYATTVDEMCGVVGKVARYLQDGVAPQSILILCRTNLQCAQMVVTLSAAGIPVTKTSYSRPAVQGCVAVSTVHGEKGGEADIVFGMGMCDRQYPCSASIDPNAPGATEAIQRAMDTARAAINVTISRARNAFHASWAVAGDSETNRPSTVSRILSESLNNSEWSVDANTRRSLEQHPEFSFSKWTAREKIPIERLGGALGQAERALFNHEEAPTLQVADVSMDSDSTDPPEIRAHSELLAAHALGHPTSTCIQHVVNHPFGPLAMETMHVARRVLEDAHRELEQNPGDPRSLLTLGVALPWSRSDYSEVSPVYLQRESTVTRDDADRLSCAIRMEAAMVASRIGAFRTMNRGRVGAGRTKVYQADEFRAPVAPPRATKTQERVLASNRAWALHENSRHSTLLTVCSSGEDPTSLLVTGALVLAADFSSESNTALDADGVDLSVAVWDCKLSKLHMMRTSLAAAVHALSLSFHRVSESDTVERLVGW
jgi:hypothetical protein